MKKITLLVAFAILSLGTFSSYAENEPDKKDGVERTYEKVKKEVKKREFDENNQKRVS